MSVTGLDQSGAGGKSVRRAPRKETESSNRKDLSLRVLKTSRGRGRWNRTGGTSARLLLLRRRLRQGNIFMIMILNKMVILWSTLLGAT